VELFKSRLGEKVLCFHGGSVITID
jgi:hypothetical protein